MARVEIGEVVLGTDGKAIPGASVTVRVRADNSLATVYAGESGATTFSNPLTTDFAGRIEGWVDAPGSYNLVVTSGSLSYTQPFAAPTALDASGNFTVPGDLTVSGSYNIADLTVSGDISVPGDLLVAGGRPWFDVTHADFGADPSGVSDSTTQVQAALNALPAGGGTVFFPAGTYKLSGSGLAKDLRRMRIVGAGKGATILNYAGSGTALAFGSVSSIQANYQVQLADLTIQGSSSGAVGLDLIRLQDYMLKNVEVSGFTNGTAIRVRGTNSGAALNTDARTSSTGVRIETLTDTANLNTFIGGQITGNGRAIHIVAGSVNVFQGCNIASTTASPAVLVELGEANAFENCYFENNATGAGSASIELGSASTARGTRIASYFSEVNVIYPVKCTRAIGTLVQGSTFGGTGMTACVRTEANASQTFIGQNDYPSGGVILSEAAAGTDTLILGYTGYAMLRKTFDSLRFLDLGLHLNEVSDLSAGATNEVKIYARDNAGKTELVARFPTGAVQRLAIEP